MSQIDLQWFADGAEERTEEATESRLRKAREEEGRVAKSQELNGTIVFLFVSFALVIMAPFILDKICEMFKYFLQGMDNENVADAKFYYAFMKYLLMISVPLCLIGSIAGILINIVQNGGWIFTTKTIEFKFSKIKPDFIQYFKKNFFSAMGLFNIGKSIVKVAVISIVAFVLIRKDINQTLGFMNVIPAVAIRIVGKMVTKLLIVSAVILTIISVFDYIMQRRDFKIQMRMTKQEVKQESKEMEGDPQVKSRLDSAQRQLLSQNMPKAVKEADVLITNPTHFAVALKWQREKNPAPVVTAKGVDETAQTMKGIARDASVPVIENRPLARSLYAETQVGDVIPVNHMKAIATVYAQINFMNKNKK